MPLPEVTIIGTGGLGQSLARALARAGISIKSIFNRTPVKANSLAEELHISVSGSFPKNVTEIGHMVFITVADGAIKDVTNRLCMLSDDFSSRTMVHCSGNESAHLLECLKDKAAVTASFHPLQTFTPYSTPKDFEGIFFSLQGDDSAFSALKELAHQLGAQTIEVSAEQKQHLHAAAVMASNYLNSLLEASVMTASLSGLSENETKRALLPLVKTTLENIAHKSFKDALSGPIKRGDSTTVVKHLKLLQEHPDLLHIYKVLGNRTVKQAQKSGSIDAHTAKKIRNLLT